MENYESLMQEAARLHTQRQIDHYRKTRDESLRLLGIDPTLPREAIIQKLTAERDALRRLASRGGHNHPRMIRRLPVAIALKVESDG